MFQCAPEKISTGMKKPGMTATQINTKRQS